MKVKLVEATKIEEGLHKGKIIDVQYRDEPFSYVDVLVQLDDAKSSDGTAIILKYGMPIKETITSRSKLGEFILKFGGEIGKEFELEKVIGQKVEVLTKLDLNGFSRIVSIKPVEA